MAYTFNPTDVFSKGIVYGEFFDVGSGELLGFSRYMSDFNINGTVNAGDVEGGPGNQLIMCIPDTARIEVTAKTADAALNNMGLTVGSDIVGNGIIETSAVVNATNTTLNISGAAAAYGSNQKQAYILNSTGSDAGTVRANSGHAYTVSENGNIENFSAVSGANYCVKYFTRNSSAEELTIPALFQPKVVRAHFAVNVYAKTAGGDAMASSLYMVRHYYFPRYFFTAGIQDAVNQTTPGTVDLSGKTLSYQETLAQNVCAGENTGNYGYIVDEYMGENSSTAAVDGIYFIGLGDEVTLAASNTKPLPVKYSVNGRLTDISDMSQVTFTSTVVGKAKFNDEHVNVITGVAAGNAVAKVSVTNSKTNVTYEDAIAVVVT